MQKQQIIDFRLRPPLYGYLNLLIWSDAGLEQFASVQGIEPAETARKRSMEMLLAEMDDCGITAGVMNGRQCGGVRGEVSNEDLARIMKEYPGRFHALAGTNPLRGKGNLAEAEHFLRDGGFKGLSLEPGLYDQAMYADDERLFPYYELCEKYNCPAVLTIGPMNGPDLSYTDPLQVDRAAARYPNVKIVVAHGCWPFAAELAGVVARRKNVYMMPDLYLFGLPGETDYLRALKVFAGSKFLFASAFPCRPIPMTVSQYRDLQLSDDLFKRVTYDNAAHLLGLAAP